MKLYLRTFGCRANQYDSEAVRAMVLAAGATIVDAPEDADVAVFNSCAVTADAVADVRQQVRRAARRSRNAFRHHGLRVRAAGRRRASLAALPGVRALVPGAISSGSPRRSACRAIASTTQPPVRRAGAAAHPGRLRRALHLLRDDAGARRAPQPRRRRARRRGTAPGRTPWRDRAHRRAHRQLGQGAWQLARRARRASRARRPARASA
jgi:hypothetical protein